MSSGASASGHVRAAPPSALVRLELVTGALGLAGGVLLAGLVGGGFLLAGRWQWRGRWQPGQCRP